MRYFFKYMYFLISIFMGFQIYLLYRFCGIFITQLRAFSCFSHFLGILPGFFGKIFSRGFYFFSLKKCGAFFTIDFGTIFPSNNVIIGNNVYIGSYCILAPCIIEEDVIIGNGVHVVSKNAHYFESISIPIRLQGDNWKQIRIGRDTWIGDKVIIMADIRPQCIIGAGSVVVKSISEKSVAVGIPAKKNS